MPRGEPLPWLGGTPLALPGERRTQPDVAATGVGVAAR
jgi:hypothetical protein